MHIKGNDFGDNFEDTLQMGNGQSKKIQGGLVFQIPDMLADKRFIAFGDTDRIF